MPGSWATSSILTPSFVPENCNNEMIAKNTYQLPNGLSIYYMNRGETDLIYHEIFNERIYARHGIELKDGDTILDIGANIGLFMLFVSRICPNAKVYSFEPVPQIFEVLERNAQLHNPRGTCLVNAGISDKRSTATFQFLPRFACSSTMYPDSSDEQLDRNEQFTLNALDQGPNRIVASLFSHLPRPVRSWVARAIMRYYAKTEPVTCQLLSVSDVIQTHGIEQIDLLKIDAEGAELDVLRGISDQDWPRVRQITIEVHRGEAAVQKVESILKTRGFETANDFSPSSPAETMVYARRPAF